MVSLIRRLLMSTGASAAFCGLVLCACAVQDGASSGVAGILARLQPLEASCHGHPMNGYFALDLDSRDRNGASLMGEHLSMLRDFANQVAACGGYLKAVGFGLDAGVTPVLSEASFPTSFGTDTARLIKANQGVDAFMEQVHSNLGQALREVPPQGNDVIAQLVLAKQFGSSRSSGRLIVEVATAGISTLGPVPMDSKDFTIRVAKAAGSRVPVPNMAGATVHIVGIGHTSAAVSSLPSGLTWNLITFYHNACARTGATCDISTDYTPS